MSTVLTSLFYFKMADWRRLKSSNPQSPACPLGYGHHSPPRWNLTPLWGNETTEVLHTATSTLYLWLLEVMKTWIGQNMSERLQGNNSTGRLVPSAGTRRAGDVRSVLTPKAGIHTLGTPLEVHTALHSSMAGPSTWAHLVSILTQRSGTLREAGPMKADTYSHQSPFPTFSLPIHPCNSMLCLHRFSLHSIFRHEQGISSSRERKYGHRNTHVLYQDSYPIQCTSAGPSSGQPVNTQLDPPSQHLG